MLFKSGMSLSERARATSNDPSIPVLAEGDFPPDKCGLSVGLRYGLLRGRIYPGVNSNMRPQVRIPLLLRLSSLLLRPRHFNQITDRTAPVPPATGKAGQFNECERQEKSRSGAGPERLEFSFPA